MTASEFALLILAMADRFFSYGRSNSEYTLDVADRNRIHLICTFSKPRDSPQRQSSKQLRPSD